MGRELGLWVLVCLGTPGHGELDDRLRDLTARLVREPERAELYLQRGELHRLHGDRAAARADYDRALARDPRLDAVELARARLALEAGEAPEARAAAERFLARRPGHPEGAAVRARALARLGDPAAGAAFSQAIAASDAPEPDLFLERAAAPGVAPDEALAGLEDGLRRLGPVPSLVLAAVGLERRSGRADAALARVAAAEAAAPRRETWAALRGEILAEAGRHAEARAAFEDALATLAALPPGPRHARSTLRLEARIRSLMEALR